jgi:hypothetical protein
MNYDAWKLASPDEGNGLCKYCDEDEINQDGRAAFNEYLNAWILEHGDEIECDKDEDDFIAAETEKSQMCEQCYAAMLADERD